MEFEVYLGLGTNLGDRKQNLNECIGLINNKIGSVLDKSLVYETPAWGITDQPSFLNQVIKLKTKYFPFQLMQKLLLIENEMGRIREVKWGQRKIDVDILFFEDLILHSNNLTIPHPFLQNRKFVLKPLNDVIKNNFNHPILKQTIIQLLKVTDDEAVISIFDTN